MSNDYAQPNAVLFAKTGIPDDFRYIIYIYGVNSFKTFNLSNIGQIAVDTWFNEIKTIPLPLNQSFFVEENVINCRKYS